MKWIKASERLPDTGVGILNYVWTRNVQTKCGGMVTLDSLLKMKGSDNVEWLDESSQFTQAAGAEVETGKNKPFIVANVREMLHDHWTGKISFSRMVELFNEVAESFYASSTTDGKRYDFREFLKWFKENYNVKIRDEVVNDYLSSLPAPPSQKH